MIALSIASLAAVASLVVPANAHMEMTYPAPFRSKSNPHATEIEYSMTSPLNADGSNYPCKGFLSDLNGPGGAVTAEWTAGQNYHFTLQGGANHAGGSCQASLSYDGGKTFTVIQSIVGNCPSTVAPTDYPVTVPGDAPSGDAIFAWTWFNNLGNREMYMNCAHIKINGGSGGSGFSSRPTIFEANIGNGCSTLEGSDVEFPNPGPDLINQSSKTAPPQGNCAAGPGSGGNQPQSSAAAPSPSSTEGGAPASSGAASSDAAPAPSSTASYDDGQWHPSSSAAAPSSTDGNNGEWQPTSSAGSSEAQPTPTDGNSQSQGQSSATGINPPTESGKNRKKKCVRRQKRNGVHGHRRAGPHGGRSRSF
ncbi:hypothetical protein A1Q2_03172 [Trichosporon asahii var. asahii CBS 8904]|uniref:Extracellular protein n=2 Tax=Trichosporon asahii var. asahii TaxID=189963 RepID=K1VPM9_TRIAC|nr:hypothetical protein A1Q1_06771 [Trichosporon asahii var. asahii CBS 2479]EJT51965.1 hypothetical protein A1Q1_06771 [Trichosporon asahii var. asahii CBS 2479]EKD02576.1 hypothetical protein A1Q2_03172 [Trichosporon asahii var. asahii CBS 8904]